MKNFLFLIIFSTSLFSAAQKADSSSKPTALREKAARLVSIAESNGYEKISNISLKELAEDIQKPSIINDDKSNTIGREGTRRDGQYYSGENAAVHLSEKENSKLNNETAATLNLHELAGASGYYDRNYALSLQILYSSKTKTNQSTVTKDYIKKQNLKLEKSLKGGSGTSVGGGGDSDTIELKILILNYLDTLKSSGIDFYEKTSLEKIAQITFECSFEFYDGAYAIFPEAYLKESYSGKDAPTRSILSTSWAQVNIRRDWFKNPNVSPMDKINLLLKGIYPIAQLEQTVCDISKLQLNDHKLLPRGK